MVSEVTERKRSIPKVIFNGLLYAGTTVRVYGGVPLIPPFLSSIGWSWMSVQLFGQPQRESVLPVAEDMAFIPRLLAGGVKPVHDWFVGDGYTV